MTAVMRKLEELHSRSSFEKYRKPIFNQDSTEYNVEKV